MSKRGEPAKIKLRGDTWHGVWKRDGLPPLRKSLDTKSRELAETKWHEIQRDLRLGTKESKEISFGDACDLYWTKHVVAQEKRAPRIIKGNETAALEFFKAGRAMSTIDADLMIAYRGWLEAQFRSKTGGVLKPGTVNKKLMYVATMSRFVAARGFKAPVFSGMQRSLNILRPNHARPPRTIETAAELQATLAAFRLHAPELLPMFIFCQLTMTRISEACGLTWAMYAKHAGEIHSTQKGGYSRTIPVPKQVAALLETQRGLHAEYIFAYQCQRNWHGTMRDGAPGARNRGECRPFGRGAVHARWERVRAVTGLREICWHAATRAFGATDLLLRGVPQGVVQKAGGWKTSAMVERYNRAVTGQIRAALEAVERPDYAPPAAKLTVVR